MLRGPSNEGKCACWDYCARGDGPAILAGTRAEKDGPFFVFSAPGETSWVEFWKELYRVGRNMLIRGDLSDNKPVTLDNIWLWKRNSQTDNFDFGGETGKNRKQSLKLCGNAMFTVPISFRSAFPAAKEQKICF